MKHRGISVSREKINLKEIVEAYIKNVKNAKVPDIIYTDPKIYLGCPECGDVVVRQKQGVFDIFKCECGAMGPIERTKLCTWE